MSAPEQGRAPAVKTVTAVSFQEKLSPSVRGSGMWKCRQFSSWTCPGSVSTASQTKREDAPPAMAKAAAGAGARTSASSAEPFFHVSQAPSTAMPAKLATSTNHAASCMARAVALSASAMTRTIAMATQACNKAAANEMTTPRRSARSLAIM
jgi:hypothetical protein